MKLIKYKNDSTNNFRELSDYVPLIISGGFFFITIMLFLYGPFKWDVNSNKINIVLMSYIVLLVLGYIIGLKFKSRDMEKNCESFFDISKILIICSLVYFIIYFPTMYATTGRFIPDFINSLRNPGFVYQRNKYYNINGSQVALYARILLAPITIGITPITLFYYEKINTPARVMGILTMIATVIMGVTHGTNKYIADFAVQLILFLVIDFFRVTNRKRYFKKLSYLLLILVTVGLFFTYYSHVMKSRVMMDTYIQHNNLDINKLGIDKFKEIYDDSIEHTGTTSEQSNDKVKENNSEKNLNEGAVIDDTEAENNTDEIINNYSTFSVAKLKEDHIIVKYLPDKIKSITLYLSSYISHGYQGLTYALEEDFTSTLGLGFSDFFRHNFLRLVGKLDLEDVVVSKTYYGKISKYGWETGLVWSTFFVYPASDIGFIGTGVLILLIGILFSLTWIETKSQVNPISTIIFFNICFIIIYFPANNQMFQGGESFLGLSTMILIWIIDRSNYLRKHSRRSK